MCSYSIEYSLFYSKFAKLEKMLKIFQTVQYTVEKKKFAVFIYKVYSLWVGE